jgi:DNA-binding SARP family transcriptional activator
MPTVAGEPRPAAAAAAPVLSIRLLGPLRVALDGTPVERWPSGRGRSLLAYLVTHRDPWPRRETLMAVFWPRSAPAAARNSLNVAVHGRRRARRAAADVPVVVADGGAYRLDQDVGLWLDVEEFERHLETAGRLDAAGDADRAGAAEERAAAVYRGDFLADEPREAWAAPTRERLRLAYLDTLDRLSRRRFDQGRFAACASLCRRIVDRDPCREDAHRRLMRCYGRLGQPRLALRQYRACARALRAELGVDPAPATAELRARLRRGQPL